MRRALVTLGALCALHPAAGSAQTVAPVFTKATYELSGSRYAWTASTMAPQIANRGQRTLSSPVIPAATMPQASGQITSVRWRYSFTRTPPVDMQAYLCNADRCVLLPGAEGKTDAFLGDDATKGFVFAYRVPGQGFMAPTLQGRSNEVTVSYR
ncbi:flagellar protein FlhE [Cupriavidus agavae]|uniref:Flagellar protein FlhE n=1 Tax=Cupriavidus agavae TaxID=1001822 RepID=A0A4Q7R8S7_9BURK|nr:flagellar protein FlhE [Cupriavidus agavae]RZT29305.1 flagellar protein FlhE [Cupriavidus agavae]